MKRSVLILILSVLIWVSIQEQPVHGAVELSVSLDRLELDPHSSVVRTSLVMTGADNWVEEVTLNAYASLYKLVWDSKRWSYTDKLLHKNLIFNDRVALSQGVNQIPVEVIKPDVPANWKLVIEVTVDFGNRSELRTLSTSERYFSTHPPAEVEEDAPYTIVVFPDTQIFAMNYPTIFTRMAGWVAENARELNIAAVLHVGDITNNDTPEQWVNAHASMSMLHGVVPYVLTLGNHDMKAGGEVTRRNLSLVNNYFEVSESKRYSGLVGTMEPDRLGNHYHIFSFAGQDYLVVALEFGPPGYVDNVKLTKF